MADMTLGGTFIGYTDYLTGGFLPSVNSAPFTYTGAEADWEPNWATQRYTPVYTGGTGTSSATSTNTDTGTSGSAAPTGPAGTTSGTSGLINSGTPTPSTATYTPTAATASPASATGYTPAPYAVPKGGTVQEQVKQIVGEDSPLMQQARASANQQMNARGLINSSIGVGAAQNAVIAQALPIAQSDAAAMQRAAENTTNAVNAAGQFKASAENSAANLNAQLATSINQSNANASTTALSDEAKAKNTAALSVIDNDTKLKLAVFNAQNQQLLQTNVSTANAFSNTITQIASIQTNKDMGAAAKSDAITSQLNMLNELLKTTAAVASTDQAAIGSLNLSGYFSNPTGLVATA